MTSALQPREAGAWLAPGDVSSELRARAAGLIAVGLAGGLVGARTAEGRGIGAALAPRATPGRHLVLGRDPVGDPHLAALWNGALMHAADYDDTHESSVVHPVSAILPAVLAALEPTATVADIVRCYVQGVVALVRLAGATPGAYHAAGFHATAVCAPVGAAAAVLAARRAPELLSAALGIAATTGGGTFEYIRSGGNAKVLYAGLAARAGLEAADFAAAGLRPPAHALDGAFGLVSAHTGAEVSLAAEDLIGTADAAAILDGVAVKSWPCCYFSQVFLDLAEILATQLDDADAITDILCEGPAQMLEPIMEPRAIREAPNDSYEARFALPFQLALQLSGQRVGIDTLDPALAGDPRISRLARLVRWRASDELGAYPERMPGRLTVTRAGGAAPLVVERQRSAGAEPAGLRTGAVARRLERDLGDRAATLVGALEDPDTSLSELAAALADAARNADDA